MSEENEGCENWISCHEQRPKCDSPSNVNISNSKFKHFPGEFWNLFSLPAKPLEKQ